MIKLRGIIGADDINNKIIFEPREGFVRGKAVAKSKEFPLIYGHRCPDCSNVIQALFKAPRTFNLWPYEETVILSQGEKNTGEIRKIFPDDKTRYGKSCYRMDFSPAEGGSVKLTLINHLIKASAIETRGWDGSGIWDVGEKPCIKAAIFSLREDLLIKDWLLHSHLSQSEVSKYSLPKLSDLIKPDNPNFKVVPAVGKATPIILVERQPLVFGYNYYTRPLMQPYIKQ